MSKREAVRLGSIPNSSLMSLAKPPVMTIAIVLFAVAKSTPATKAAIPAWAPAFGSETAFDEIKDIGDTAVLFDEGADTADDDGNDGDIVHRSGACTHADENIFDTEHTR